MSHNWWVICVNTSVLSWVLNLLLVIASCFFPCYIWTWSKLDFRLENNKSDIPYVCLKGILHMTHYYDVITFCIELTFCFCIISEFGGVETVYVIPDGNSATWNTWFFWSVVCIRYITRITQGQGVTSFKVRVIRGQV